MEILLGIIVILLVISNVYLMIAMQRQNRKPEINPQIEEIRREVVGLQRMFTGVKTRGIWGEWQLGSILDETLTPDQYETECMVIPGRTTRVEYAVKLPGRYEEPVYLPIDSKFPLDAYLQYEEALQSGNREMAEDAEKILIIGSGLVGLDAAYGLIERGKKVTVVEMAEQILPVQESLIALSL